MKTNRTCRRRNSTETRSDTSNNPPPSLTGGSLVVAENKVKKRHPVKMASSMGKQMQSAFYQKEPGLLTARKSNSAFEIQV